MENCVKIEFHKMQLINFLLNLSLVQDNVSSENGLSCRRKMTRMPSIHSETLSFTSHNLNNFIKFAVFRMAIHLKHRSFQNPILFTTCNFSVQIEAHQMMHTNFQIAGTFTRKRMD